jgi:inosine/xanthosine triphosphatase
MERQRIAIGSIRGPKLDAVTDALKEFAPLLSPNLQFETRGFEVDSGVGHTPISSAQSMTGARQRAEALIRKAAEESQQYQFYVGLEGGLDVVPDPDSRFKTHRRVFLESWAYVTDGTHGYYGRSGGIEIPQALAVDVLENGLELSVAIDKFAGLAGIRDRQGAWGVLSGDLISRREAFRVAVIAAFAPFYNAPLYRARRAAG